MNWRQTASWSLRQGNEAYVTVSVIHTHPHTNIEGNNHLLF